jgi:hypothetical protein
MLVYTRLWDDTIVYGSHTHSSIGSHTRLWGHTPHTAHRCRSTNTPTALITLITLITLIVRITLITLIGSAEEVASRGRAAEIGGKHKQRQSRGFFVVDGVQGGEEGEGEGRGGEADQDGEEGSGERGESP